MKNLARAFFFVLGFVVGPTLSTFLLGEEDSGAHTRSPDVELTARFPEGSEMRASLSYGPDEPTATPLHIRGGGRESSRSESSQIQVSVEGAPKLSERDRTVH